MSGDAVHLARRLAALSPEKRALLLRRLRGPAAPATLFDPAIAPPAAAPAAPPVAANGGADSAAAAPFPLTSMQRLAWMCHSDLFDLGGCGANAYFELHFSAPLQDFVVRLDHALGRLVARHPMLRSAALPDGSQRLLESPPPYRPRVFDLRGLAASAAEAALARLRDRLRYAAADVTRWPLFDAGVSLLAAGELHLHLRFEALIMDGGSRNILFDELFRLLAEPELELPPLTYSYRQLALAVAASAQDPAYARAREHWRRRLPALPPPPELPAYGVSPRTRGETQNRFAQALDPGGWAALRARAARARLTPSAAVFAAFAEAVAVWSRGAPFSLALEGTYRPPLDPGIERVVGNFNTVLLVAVDFAPGGFAERARRLQDQAREGLDHRRFSGEEVIRELYRQRGGGSRLIAPVIFNSLIEFNRGNDPADRASQLALGARYVDAGLYAAHCLLLLSVDQFFNGALGCRLQAVEQVFPEGVAAELLAAFCRRLQGLAAAEEDWEWSWPETARRLVPAAQLAARARRAAGPRLPSSPPLPELLARRRAQGGDERGEAAFLASAVGDRGTLAGTLADLGRRLGIGGRDRCLSFWPGDPALEVLVELAALAAGAALVAVPPLPDGAAGSPASWLATVQRSRVTVWSSPPALLDRLAAAAEAAAARLNSLWRVLVARDRVPTSLPGRLRGIAPRARLFALRGGAEAGLAAALSPFGSGTAGWEPYGAPLAGRRLHLLGAAGEPCPDWVVGEVCLGGAAPAAQGDGNGGRDTGERLRPTGELARYRPGGELELVGRAGEALAEILGYPVELPRVERLLESHPAVRAAAAVAVAWRGCDRLVAFAAGAAAREEELLDRSEVGVSAGGAAAREEELRRFLARESPAYYLVPDELVYLDELPLTVRGTLDRTALGALGAARLARREGRGAPLVPGLARIWGELLGASSPDPEDDFFSCGGTSFLLVRLMRRIGDQLGARAPLLDFFRDPTLGGLSRLLAGAGAPAAPGPPALAPPGLEPGSGRPTISEGRLR